MQIKPHQIPHFARQRERIKQIRLDLVQTELFPTTVGTVFSERFVMWSLVSEFYLDVVRNYEKLNKDAEIDLLMNGVGVESNIKGIND